MSEQEPVILLILKFFIPAFFSMMFRVFGLGAKNRFRAVTGMMIFLAYMTLVPFALFHLIPYSVYRKIVIMILFAGNMFVFYISSDGFWKTAFLHASQANVVLVISIVCNGIRHIFQLGYLKLCIMEFVICLVVYVLARRYAAKPFRYTADHIYANWVLMVIIPMAILISNIIVVTYFNIDFNDQPLRNMLVVLTQEFIFFMYLWMLYRNLRKMEYYSEKEKQQEILFMATKNMEQRLTIMEENEKKSRRESHDRRHFNHMLLELMQSGQTHQAMEALQKQDQKKITIAQTYCENAMVNAAVTYYAEWAMRNGIETKIQLELGKKLQVDELELSLALSNLMENAMNACEQIPEEQTKFIHMQCRDLGRLVLEVSNSCMGKVVLDEEGYPVTNESGHGIGTKSVRAFVEKYDGELLYKVDQERFQVRMLI